MYYAGRSYEPPESTRAWCETYPIKNDACVVFCKTLGVYEWQCSWEGPERLGREIGGIRITVRVRACVGINGRHQSFIHGIVDQILHVSVGASGGRLRLPRWVGWLLALVTVTENLAI